MSLASTRCVVLNSSYEPLSVVSAKRGLRLLIEGRAVLTEKHPNDVVRTVTKKFPLPTQVRLVGEYIKTQPAMRVPAHLTQRNLFLRDQHQCQYCGRHKSELGEGEYLTRDHIIPVVRGGKNVWKNVVAACRKCNNMKSDFMLTELEDMYYRMAEDPEQEEAAQWLLENLVGKHLNPRAPMILEIWSKTGKLKLRKHKDK